MREIRPSGSEGGVALTTPSLPLSNSRDLICGVGVSAIKVRGVHGPAVDHPPAGIPIVSQAPPSRCAQTSRRQVCFHPRQPWRTSPPLVNPG